VVGPARSVSQNLYLCASLQTLVLLPTSCTSLCLRSSMLTRQTLSSVAFHIAYLQHSRRLPSNKTRRSDGREGKKRVGLATVARGASNETKVEAPRSWLIRSKTAARDCRTQTAALALVRPLLRSPACALQPALFPWDPGSLMSTPHTYFGLQNVCTLLAGSSRTYASKRAEVGAPPSSLRVATIDTSLPKNSLENSVSLCTSFHVRF